MSETGTVLIKEFGLQKELQKWFELVPTTSCLPRRGKQEVGGVEPSAARGSAKQRGDSGGGGRIFNPQSNYGSLIYLVRQKLIN